jgi:hypothetical protein
VAGVRACGAAARDRRPADRPRREHEERLVQFVIDAADKLDLGVFDREIGIKDFTGKNAEVKDALLNWGLAAIVWLIGGRILDRIIRP